MSLLNQTISVQDSKLKRSHEDQGCDKLNLKRLTQEELLGRFNKLVRTERKITHLVLECIAEIDRRKIYLEKAYSSLYDFLVKAYGYSPSVAVRRIESARLLRELPGLSVQIEEGSLHLTQLSQVQQAVRALQKQESRKISGLEKQALLKKIEYTTQAQTEIILSKELNLPIPTKETKVHHRNESISLTLHLTVEQKDILQQAKDLLGHAFPDQTWVGLMTYLAKNEIKRRTKPGKRTNKKIEKEKKFDSATSATVVDRKQEDFFAKRKVFAT